MFTSAPQVPSLVKSAANANMFFSSPLAAVWAEPPLPSVCRCKAMIHPSSIQLFA